MTLDPGYMKVIITYTFCCNNLWKSIIMALKKPGKLDESFLFYFVATGAPRSEKHFVEQVFTFVNQELLARFII